MIFEDLKALHVASMTGKLSVVEMMINRGKVDQQALRVCMLTAAENGQLDVLKIIHEELGHSSSTALTALTSAAHCDRVECVKYLIQFCDPKKNGSQALLRAAEYGNEESIRALLPVSNASQHKSKAFSLACVSGSSTWKICLELLYPHSSRGGIEKGLSFARSDEMIGWIKERLRADDERRELEKFISAKQAPVARKSGRL